MDSLEKRLEKVEIKADNIDNRLDKVLELLSSKN